MKSKSKFLTYLFSLLPGAGQMYLGFMKQGMTLMFVFFFSIFLTDFFRISLLIAILPVIWCYSFFDTINKAALPPEQLAAIEDKSMLEPIFKNSIKINLLKYTWLGVILIVVGVLLIFNNIILVELERMQIIERYIVSEYLRTLIASGTIIGLGIWMLLGRKEAKKPGDKEVSE